MSRNPRLGEFVICPKCFACAASASPHGDGVPCPLSVAEHEALLVSQRRMLDAEVQRADAQRMSAIKAGVGLEDLLGFMRTQFGISTDDEDDETS